MQRSNIWDPATWDAYADVPDGAAIIVCQNLVGDEVTADMVRADLADGYAHDLAEERR